MFAKLFVWVVTSVRVITKMRRTLSECVIFGVRTNIPLLMEMLSHEEFLAGTMTTRFFETHFGKGLSASTFSESELKMVQSLKQRVGESGTTKDGEGNPWAFNWGGE